jgi:uncharacterized alpha-E superfamily protein
MARLLEVGYRISLMPSAIEGHLDEWRSTLRGAACEWGYSQKHQDITGQKVISYLLFDQENPSSVKSCLETARNNARAVRTAITRDVWESLNSTWNEFAQVRPSDITSDRLPGFLEWIRQRAMMFRGALLGTMLRTDNYFFSQLGNFVERADTTARILDVKYYILLPRPDDVGSELDMQQWAQVLRSVSAHRAYRWFYRESRYRPWLIAEFLILKDEMPRSLVFSYRWVNTALDGLAELYDQRYDCHDMARETYRRLHSGSMDEIFQQGLHEFLQEFLKSNARLSESIARTYNFP